MSIKIPYMRKDTWTLLTISATAIALLLLASPLALSNPLLQPAQAQTTPRFRAVGSGSEIDPPSGEEVVLTFNAQGTASSSSSNPQSAKITNGTIQLRADPSNGQNYTAKISKGTFVNDTRGGDISFSYSGIGNIASYTVFSDCSTSEENEIDVTPLYSDGHEGEPVAYTGTVECSFSQEGGGGNTTTSSMTGTTTTTTQQDSDGDRDGIPDSSDKCTHNSNPKCFKEGGDVCTTAQQQPSSTTRTWNQTR